MNWAQRTGIIASAIPRKMSVLDLGGGFCNLYKHLKECRRYVSLDLEEWTDATVKIDFNKDKLPEMEQFDYLVCQGTLEYLNEPEKFLRDIRKYGGILLLTYWFEKLADGKWRNKLNPDEFKDILRKAGWMIVFERSVSGRQKLFYCVKI